jgi:ArsR family transcriptional regulator
MQRTKAKTSSAATLRKSAPIRLTRARRTAILKALADPNRYVLLERISSAACELGCSDVRSLLRISPATLSHHIKELELAGLVQVRREGRSAYLSPRPGTVEALIAALASLSASCPATVAR